MQIGTNEAESIGGAPLKLYKDKKNSVSCIKVQISRLVLDGRILRLERFFSLFLLD